MIKYKAMNRLFIIFQLLTALSITTDAQTKTETRLSLAKEFVTNLAETQFSNEHIVEKYTEPGSYFNNDSIKRVANQGIDHQRKNLRMMKRKDMGILKYQGNEKKFMEMDNPPGEPLAPPVLQELKFSLSTSKGRDLYVNLDDLYIVTEKNKAIMFILFNDEDKIITFSALRFDSEVGLWQY
jgi:hypothetical protein